jgi:DNA-binding CsgD family transcriptional regulator
MRKELTSQEQKVFNLLVEGISPKDIAYKLNISNRTLDFHRNNIYKKLDIHSVQELLAKHKSAGDNTETASSAEPEAALSVNIKNKNLKLLIPLGIGILIGVISMLFVGRFFMKPSVGDGGIIDTAYFRADRWVNHFDESIHGESYSTQGSIKLAGIYPAGFEKLIPLEKGKNRRIRLSGTIDKKLDHIKIDIFHIDNSTKKAVWLAGSNICEGIGPGGFWTEIVIERGETLVSTLPPGEVVISILEPLLNVSPEYPDWSYNYGKIPDDIPDGTIVATIRNLRIEPVVP